jgi:hypothetical protein
VISADRQNFYANGEGDVPIEIPRDGGTVCIVLRNVLHAAEMPIGLVSVSSMTRSGYKANFDERGCQTHDPDGKYVTTVTPVNGLYPIGTLPTPATLPMPVAMKASITKMLLLELHRRMGHAHAAELCHMVSNGMVTGVELTETEMPTCETCIASKHTETSFPLERSSSPASQYGELVHCDVWGPASTKTFGGKQYYCSHIDNYSDECVLFLLRTKNKVFKCYKDYKAWAKHHREVTAIGSHQSDCGGKYMDNNFISHLQSQGTVIRQTVHDSPSQNGKAERLNRTIPEHVRTMRIEARLPKALWGEATMHAVWLRNRTTTKNTPGSTPYEKATGRKPDLSALLVFGADVWVKVDATSKLDPKSVKARWVGYNKASKGHHIWWPGMTQISVKQNVIFLDSLSGEEVRVPLEGESLAMNERNAPSPPDSSSEDPPQPAKTSPRTENPPEIDIEPVVLKRTG